MNWCCRTPIRFLHILVGESVALQGRPKDAIQEFKRAIELVPEMPRLHFGLGFLYWEEQAFNGAERELTEEVGINPHFAPAQYYLGKTSLNRNDIEKAATSFQRAVADNPKYLDAYLGLVKTRSRRGQFQEARGEFIMANSLDPARPMCTVGSQ